MKRQAISLMLCLCLFAGQPVYADIASTEQELNDTNDYLETLNQKQTEILDSINQYNSDIFDLTVEINDAENGIANTEKDIVDQEKLISATAEQLAEVEDSKDIQYESMKKRIQCLYEQGGNIGIFVSILNENNLEEALNKIEYSDSIAKYDKLQLTEYIKTVKSINYLQEKQQKENAELREKKKLLVAEKAGLESKKAELEEKINAAEEANSQTAAEIQQTQEKANELTLLIQQMKEEEERQRQAEIAAQQEAESAVEESTSISTSDDDYNDTSSSYVYVSSGDSGEDIVSYAEQFVGYPYVWGGDSLTSGIDCSHFVWRVLMNTGHYSGDYETSSGWPYLGTAVNGLENAQAGDVICYSGHVAIYDGNGGIIEAKGSAWGITHDRSADCKTIVAIRRFI